MARLGVLYAGGCRLDDVCIGVCVDDSDSSSESSAINPPTRFGFRIDDRELVLDPSCAANVVAGSLSPSLSLKVRVSDSMMSAAVLVEALGSLEG